MCVCIYIYIYADSPSAGCGCRAWLCGPGRTAGQASQYQPCTRFHSKVWHMLNAHVKCTCKFIKCVSAGLVPVYHRQQQ